MGCSKGAGVGWDTARAPDCVFDVSAWHVEGMLVFVLEHVAYVGFACSSAAADLLLWQLGWVKTRLEKSARPPAPVEGMCGLSLGPSAFGGSGWLQSAHCPAGWLQPSLYGKILCREKCCL